MMPMLRRQIPILIVARFLSRLPRYTLFFIQISNGALNKSLDDEADDQVHAGRLNMVCNS
jgi:hypothetical protein